MIAVIARQQVQSLVRQRVFLATAGILLLMTALAGVIGWSSHDTIVRVYDQATIYLADQGRPAPPNPFDLKPTLSLLSNMVIYVPLIGALLALVVGHLSVADDETNGLGRLIFTRPISRASYLAGKALAVAVVLAATMVACLVVSLVALLLVNGTAPTATEVGRLGLFYALSWLYLEAFALVGMVTVLLTSRRPLALLVALGVWLIVTFALPEFTSGLHPVASLNPIVDPVSTSQTFFRITSKAASLSVFEQYKNASAQILATATANETGGHVALRSLPLLGAIGGLGGAAAGLVRRHDYSKESSDV